MKENFSKTKLLGATRQILTEIAAWTETLFGAGSAERLTGMEPGRDLEWEDSGVTAYIERSAAVKSRKWNEPGCAGPITEQSTVLKLTAKVIDFLNTNTWQGDAEDFWLSFIALYPLQAFLEDNWHLRKGKTRMALQYAIDDALDRNAAERLFKALKAFSVRVNIERSSNELTISELAFISGLAEKTVRMAAIGQDRNPDLVTHKTGGSTYISVEEARRWMASKNIDCRPPQFVSQKSLPPVEPKSLAELGDYLQRTRKAAGLDGNELAKKLNWKKKTLEAYRKLEAGVIDSDLIQFSTTELVRLAIAILPEHRKELVQLMDQVIHPVQLNLQIEQGCE